jgi:hypothetical protein
MRMATAKKAPKKLPRYITSVEFPVKAIHMSEDERNPRIDYIINGTVHTHPIWSTVHKLFPKLKQAIGMGHSAWGTFDAIRKKAQEGKFTIRFTINQKDSYIIRLRYLPTGKLIQVYGSTYEGWGYAEDNSPVSRALKAINKKRGWV